MVGLSVHAFPVEIVEVIIDWMDDPDVLLSLALTSKAFYSLLVPRHTQARILRLPLYARCAWLALANDPRLARNIRSLEIVSLHPVDEKQSLFPNFDDDCLHCSARLSSGYVDIPSGNKFQQDSETLLMAAIKNMANLTSFRWKTNLYSTHLKPSEDVWSQLASSCPNLTEISVRESTGGVSYLWDREILSMSNLTVFEFETTNVPCYPWDFTRMGPMLRERCPGLQRLHLILQYDYSLEVLPADISDAILAGRWPHLSSLKFSNVSSTPEAFVAFLHAHPGIVNLAFDNFIACYPIPDLEDESPFAEDDPLPAPLACDPGILPNLNNLVCCPGPAIDILAATLQSTAGERRIAVKIWLMEVNPRLQAFIDFAKENTSLEVSSLDHLEKAVDLRDDTMLAEVAHRYYV
ncbi:hypothetical protein FA95DRAFT_1565637 [Auriscalpium vulgare]|uniref:Uncharacterized protein n=1 Tax=Auriscalpium vulgare TaxID=40419 RepID=A0ACB8RAY9_9AGAM|nr:hypothetical protein FA95DRAFT_1565637 [Auriscalpium vulgare]